MNTHILTLIICRKFCQHTQYLFSNLSTPLPIPHRTLGFGPSRACLLGVAVQRPSHPAAGEVPDCRLHVRHPRFPGPTAGVQPERRQAGESPHPPGMRRLGGSSWHGSPGLNQMDSNTPSRVRVPPSQRRGQVCCAHEEALLQVNTVTCPSCQPVGDTRAEAVCLVSLAPDNHCSQMRAGFYQEPVIGVLHRPSHLILVQPRGLGPRPLPILQVSQPRLAEFKKQVSDETQLGRGRAEIQTQVSVTPKPTVLTQNIVDVR